MFRNPREPLERGVELAVGEAHHPAGEELQEVEAAHQAEVALRHEVAEVVEDLEDFLAVADREEDLEEEEEEDSGADPGVVAKSYFRPAFRSKMERE